jgi:hypothetical protein
VRASAAFSPPRPAGGGTGIPGLSIGRRGLHFDLADAFRGAEPERPALPPPAEAAPAASVAAAPPAPTAPSPAAPATAPAGAGTGTPAAGRAAVPSGPAASSHAAAHPPAAPAATPAPQGPDLEELARLLYDRVHSRLRFDLLIDRERAGRLADLG